MKLQKGAHVHFIGICGTAMASLAGLMKSLGYKVTGSDQNVYPPMSTQLEQLQIPIMQGYKKENLTPKPDFVIVGNVVSKINPEAEALLASDIPYTSLPKAMGEYVIENRESVVVAGTHGKTTTTSMFATVAEAAAKKPGFLIGGIPENFSNSFRIPQDNWFVIEGDEYDTAFFDKVPKFIHYKPKHVILTSIEFDHADIYRDLDHVKDAFRMLLRLIPQDGHLVVHAEDQNIKSILSETKCKNIVTYGENSGDYQIVDRETVQGRNQFSVKYKGEKIADIAIKLFGPHNSLNAIAVFALAHQLGWPVHQILQGLANFKGVKRRQEIIGEPKGVKIIEDFAHHPTAVRLTIKSIQEMYPGKKVFAVFEPRSATSRRKVFQKDYVEALSSADEIYVAEAFDQSKINEGDRFSTDQLIQDIKANRKSAFIGKNADHIVEMLSPRVKSGDVVLIMSNGGFDGIYQKLIKAI